MKTDCDKLPAERELQRKDDAELGLGRGAKKAPLGTVFELNTAARDELMSIQNVGKTMADRIIQGRPYETFEELDEVEGVGPTTLEGLKQYLRIADQKGNSATPSQ